MTMSDEEIRFWKMKGISSEYMVKDRFSDSEKMLELS
jgi:hypothetical protein